MKSIISLVMVCILAHTTMITNIQEPSVQKLIEQAQLLQKTGKYQEAIQIYQKALTYAPNNAEIYFYLGNLFFYAHNYQEAIYHYQKCIDLNPRNVQAYYNLGVSEKIRENTSESIAAFSREVTLNPTSAKSYLQLAQATRKQNKKKEATAYYKEAIQHDPNNAQAHYEYATLLYEQELFEDAITHLNHAIRLNPTNYAYYFELGNAFLHIGRIDESINAFKQVLRANPHATAAEYNIGYALKTAGRLDEAIAIYKSILSRIPDHNSRMALGFAQLMGGNFKEGWETHSHYLKSANKNADELRTLLKENRIAGHTVLLVPEGGLGDSINFIRYAERLKKMGAKVIVSIQKDLAPLIARCPYIDQLFISGSGAAPSHHARSTLMSLPAVFHDDQETIPRNIPYIYPDEALVELWKKRLESDTSFKVGICWEASIYNDSSRLPIARRGIPLMQFYKLNTIPGITWYSLQKKDGVEQLDTRPVDFNINILDRMYDVDEASGPFMDTVAIMQNLDLIITIDTATAHLAGALGKPVWLLLPFSTDWRWLVGKTTSPWYPTMRIFQQPAPFDWNTPIQQVHAALTTLISQRT